MNTPVSTLTETLLDMVPGLAVGLFACVAWYFICRFLKRRQDAAWHAALPVVPVAEQRGSSDVQIKDVELRLACLHVRRMYLVRGSPSDRLFALGLLVAVVFGIAAMLLFLFNPF